MTIANGAVVTKEDLNTIWTAVSDIQLLSDDKYEIDVHSFEFDGIHSDLIDTIRWWIPSADCQILKIVAVVATNTVLTGSLNIEFTGSLKGFTFNVPYTQSNTERTVISPPVDGVYMAVSGDIVQARVTSMTYSGPGPEIIRIHLVTKTAWRR